MLLAIELAIEDDGRLGGVPVVVVVWRRLEVPNKLAVVRIQGDDGGGIEAILALIVGVRRSARWNAVAGPEKIQIQVGIVSPRQPWKTAAFEHRRGIGPRFGTWLPRIGSYPPLPLQCTGFGIVRFHEGPDIVVVAGRDDHVITDNHGSD